MLEIISKKSQAYGEFNNGEIIEYEKGKGIERYKVYLKENGWFTVCDCVTDSKEFIDCNPYKFKDNNECWNLKIHTEDGNEKGFYFLNLIDAALHDSHVSFDCFLLDIFVSLFVCFVLFCVLYTYIY